MGSTILMGKDGGTVDLSYQVSSVVIPVTRIQLIWNGEVKEMKTTDPSQTEFAGSWSFNTKESGWLALRIFGKHPDRNEIVAAHSSPVMVKVGDKQIYSSMDAMSILEEIEGASAYIKSVATRATERQYAAIMAQLTAAHRKLHNYMHLNEVYHDHTHDHDHHN
jgi:hypothetical protein